jgi:hypothetical protein
MAVQPTTVRVTLRSREDVGPDDLERLAGRLRDDLLALDVEQVTGASAGPAPAGAKGVEVAELGVLMVTLAKSPALLGQVVTVVRGWLQRRRELAISLEIGDAKLTIGGDLPQAERQRLIDVWVDRAIAQPAATTAVDTAPPGGPP